MRLGGCRSDGPIDFGGFHGGRRKAQPRLHLLPTDAELARAKLQDLQRGLKGGYDFARTPSRWTRIARQAFRAPDQTQRGTPVDEAGCHVPGEPRAVLVFGERVKGRLETAVRACLGAYALDGERRDVDG
jgi:hypothetical protein